MPTKREDLDPVRLLVVQEIERHSTTLAAVSRELGRNHAYLHQFIHRRTPRRLPEDIRHALAAILRIDERRLADPNTHRARAAREPGAPQAGAAPLTTRRLSSFAARLSIARAESEFETPSAFAYAADIDRWRYADLEDGKEEPTLGELDRIHQVSKKPLDWLIRGSDDDDPGGFARPVGSDYSDVERSLAAEIRRSRDEPEQLSPGARKRR